ncbi:glutaredoxin [Microthyrium microscopicum]|uniref:Glutaredoxin n=1 Tax=Microthyrium microscopicum TaxID=703497 RepID=A0A6A6UJW8_9PEZI|nr:glutaredoxin [Microthyrium microscopicum]
MPPNRRIRALMMFAIAAIIAIIYISTSASQTRTNKFYTSTRDALSLRESEEAGGKALESDDGAVQARLKDAADKAKQSADKKAEEFHGADVKEEGQKINSEIKATGEDGVARKSFKGNSDKVMKEAEGRMDREHQQRLSEEPKETEEEHKAEEELNYILKRSPIIIFSKTYCPFSKKAKDILLNKYKITPAPYVVELDEHAIGHDLQDKLAKTSGRRTVPNILINGISIGGGDDIEELHQSDKLISKVVELAGKKVQIKKI